MLPVRSLRCGKLARTNAILRNFKRNRAYGELSAAKIPAEKSILARFLSEMIKTSGPLTLSSFMQQCLTNPEAGYYTTRDPFGRRGDFVTSPEISQMFGELVAVWIANEYVGSSAASPMTLIELGPGRGTLMQDVLRTLARLSPTRNSVSRVYLVESSPVLRDIQRVALCGQSSSLLERPDGTYSARRNANVEIVWCEEVSQLPTHLTNPFFVAHEFFDALPIHSFERTLEGWRELMVDVSSSTTGDSKFHMTRAKRATQHSELLSRLSPRYNIMVPPARVEVSFVGLSIMRQISDRLRSAGSGAALIMDYGPSHVAPVDTLRAIRAHKLVNPFVDVGDADLSADVDFSGLAEVARGAGLQVHGPMMQGDWLHAMGIEVRKDMVAARDENARERINAAYHRLTDKTPNAMGKIYKFMAVSNTDAATAFPR